MDIEPIIEQADIEQPQSLLISSIVRYKDCFGKKHKTVFSRFVRDADFYNRPTNIEAGRTSKGDMAT